MSKEKQMGNKEKEKVPCSNSLGWGGGHYPVLNKPGLLQKIAQLLLKDMPDDVRKDLKALERALEE